MENRAEITGKTPSRRRVLTHYAAAVESLTTQAKMDPQYEDAELWVNHLYSLIGGLARGGAAIKLPGLRVFEHQDYPGIAEGFSLATVYRNYPMADGSSSKGRGFYFGLDVTEPVEALRRELSAPKKPNIITGLQTKIDVLTSHSLPSNVPPGSLELATIRAGIVHELRELGSKTPEKELAEKAEKFATANMLILPTH